MSTLKKALELAERGIAVFPCNAKKAPMIEGGFKNAGTDPATIKEWFRKPDTLIGVPTGERFVVIDCDLAARRGAAMVCQSQSPSDTKPYDAVWRQASAL